MTTKRMIIALFLEITESVHMTYYTKHLLTVT